MTTTQADKVRENKVRRAAERQGLHLVKSRRRDPHALDFGKFWLATIDENVLVMGDEFGTSLDDIEGTLAAGFWQEED